MCLLLSHAHPQHAPELLSPPIPPSLSLSLHLISSYYKLAHAFTPRVALSRALRLFGTPL
jgi:hypothetical protein